METAVLAGILLLSLLLLLLTVGEALPARCGSEETAGIVTVLPLCGETGIRQLKQLLMQLDWTDESLVGTVILLDLEMAPAVRDYCRTLSTQRPDFFLCTPPQLAETVLRLTERTCAPDDATPPAQTPH